MRLSAGAATLSAGGGLRILSSRPAAGPAPLASASPPLEGPLAYVALTLTDQASDEYDFFATEHAGGVQGSPLPGATTNTVIAILDSGAGTHLVVHDDAVALGLQGALLTGNTISIGGAGGTVEATVSMPVGFFLHGVQDLTAGGTLPSNLAVGQGNFSCVVSPETETNNIPTAIGAPFLGFFAALIQNSQPVRLSLQGQPISSPSVTFYADPDDPTIPTLDRRIYLEVRPATPIFVAYYVDLLDLELTGPSTIGLASALFYTANDVSLTEGTTSLSGKMVMDTGAQGTLISRITAIGLGLDLQHPDFETEVGGIGGTVMAPGFYLDRLQIPAEGGALSWTNVPVIVLNVMGPESTVLFGIFGTNLTKDRDVVFNGATTFPYLDVSAPLLDPHLRITAFRVAEDGRTEIDWWNEPAPGILRLDACAGLRPGSPVWTPVDTAQMSTLRGTFSVTNTVESRFFRLAAP